MPEQAAAIAAAIAQAITPAFRAAAFALPSPYGEPGVARRIAAVLAEVPLEGLWHKRFHDLPGPA